MFPANLGVNEGQQKGYFSFILPPSSRHHCRPDNQEWRHLLQLPSGGQCRRLSSRPQERIRLCAHSGGTYTWNILSTGTVQYSYRVLAFHVGPEQRCHPDPAKLEPLRQHERAAPQHSLLWIVFNLRSLFPWKKDHFLPFCKSQRSDARSPFYSAPTCLRSLTPQRPQRQREDR